MIDCELIGTTVCKNIMYFMEERGLRQTDLAEKLDLNKKTLSNWLHFRSRPDISLLPSICEALHVSLPQLYGIQESNLSPEEQLHLASYRRLDADQQRYIDRMTDGLADLMNVHTGGRSVVDGVVNDVMNDVTNGVTNDVTKDVSDLIALKYFERGLAAGFDFYTEQEQMAETVYVYASTEAEQADFIFSVSGDSMEPKFHNGDRVLVKKQNTLQYGEIGAFMIGGEQYIKQYEADGLHSLNNHYKTMTPEEYGEIYVIGLVVGTVDEEDFATEEDIQRFEKIRR